MPKKIPQRSCMGCGEVKDKTELVRISRLPDGSICVDTSGKTSGRGAYVCRNADCLKKLRKKNGLAKAFSMPVPDTVYDELEKEIAGEE